ncbi:MAG TPA: aromatic ring-hydroxylating dioxygenase subunit alpha [Rhizomicrobium sp.]|jgi:choline monooxygenase|nr:aromatic ring-hydroxylating dioxygenase subunit alpha [Rhizomicrobium sp.]
MQSQALQTLPAELYRDRGTYETERRAVFGHSWLFLGHESQLPGPGNYISLTFAGFPLFAVRGKDGTIRAFHNVCRHRAGPLVEDGSGSCGENIVCRYHGWRYALDGRLASARDFGPANDFDVRDYGLIALRCETWRGFLFANMDANADPLEQTIAPLEREAGALGMERFVFKRFETHEIKCNWKTYVENYLEGYHIQDVHPGLNAAVDARRYEVNVVPPAIFHRAPPRNDAPVAGLWAWLWPCLGVNVYADGMMMERMSPVGHERTRLDYLYFFPADVPAAEVERAIGSSAATTAEDIRITEAVQRNLDAGVYETGRLSPKHEVGVAWFQGRILEALDRA